MSNSDQDRLDAYFATRDAEDADLATLRAQLDAVTRERDDAMREKDDVMLVACAATLRAERAERVVEAARSVYIANGEMPTRALWIALRAALAAYDREAGK